MTWVRLLLVVLVVGAPSYQVGALFPALVSRFPSDRVGHAAGRAVLASTVGNVGGALVAAFVAIPLRGVEWTLGMASALALVPALIAGWRGGRVPFAGIAVASGLSCALSLAFRPAWDAAALRRGATASWLSRERAEPGRLQRRAVHREPRALFSRRPGRDGDVLGHAGGERCSLYSLRVNGKAEGSVLVSTAARGPRPRG